VIVAFIDDQAVFANLRVQIFVEHDDAGDACVRHMHVADAAAGGFLNNLAARFDPVDVTQLNLTANRTNDCFPRAVGTGD